VTEPAGAARASLSPGAVHILSIVLGLAAAALVFWHVERAESTDCFEKSVEITIAGSDVLERCDLNAFDAVRAFISEQREPRAADEPPPEETDQVAARSALIVWLALFAATAGFATVVAVHSSTMLYDLRPSVGRGFVLRSVGAVALAVLPFVLFRSLPYEFGEFDDLHRPQLKLIPPVIGILMLPAVLGLVGIRDLLADRALTLDDVDRLGARMRRLVGMLGAVLALAIVTTAARWDAIATLPGGEALPSTVILLWGATFAVGLATIYVPVHQRWAETADTLIREEVARQEPNTSPKGTGGYRAAELALTKELKVRLGVGGPLKTLQGSVSLLAPVLAAAVSSLFA